jgi:hypothetical protein
VKEVLLTHSHAGRLHAKRDDSREREAATHSERSERHRDDAAKRGVRKESDRKTTQ